MNLNHQKKIFHFKNVILNKKGNKVGFDVENG